MFNPEVEQSPTSFEIPWARVPYRKITVEDVKESMSTHFQFTPYDPYEIKAMVRAIVVSVQLGLIVRVKRLSYKFVQIVRMIQQEFSGYRMGQCHLQRLYHSLQVDTTPAYFANTTAKVSTDSFYWSSRLIAGLADAHYLEHLADIESYQKNTLSRGEAMIAQVDAKLEKGEAIDFEAENQQMSDFIEEKTAALLDKVLLRASNLMVNHYSVSD